LATTIRDSNTSQRLRLEKFGARTSKYGVNFAVCDISGELIMLSTGGEFETDRKQLKQLSRQVINHTSQDLGTKVEDKLWQLGEDNQILAIILRSSDKPASVAFIDSGKLTIDRRLLGEMLLVLAEDFHNVIKAGEHIEMVSTELSQVYEELVLLQKLSTNMRITESDFNYLQMACDSLTEIVGVEGIAILLQNTIDGNNSLHLSAGWGVIDINEEMTGVLHSRLIKEMSKGREVLLDSEVDSPFKYDWPGSIKNIIVVPLCGKGKAESNSLQEATGTSPVVGMMVAINRVDKPDFDSIDVKLFNSVASGCAVFVENGNLFKDLKELFIGSLKALTSTIDAKDPYTRGHSERVAFVSRWISERLAEQEKLSQEQIQKIYLAGLLHDIGKIGILETVLRKNGKLTKQEFDHIKMHPSIGAGILSGIKQMQDVVPGVLCHHERVDGKGYTHGLVGDQIPLIGKIVGLADSFDAMTTKRTYRDARDIDQAIVEIEKELGAQFDETVGRAFLQSDVHYLWHIMRNGFDENYGTADFSDYGTVAVGALIQ